MDVKTYKSIVTVIRKYKGLSKNCLSVLVATFPFINHDTLYSILSLEYQKRMRVNHVKSQSVINKYWDLYQMSVKKGAGPGIILQMAQQFDICPCLIAKLILQKYFEECNMELTQINAHLRDTSLIPDPHLAYEVFLCTIYDNLYSPLSETMKHSLGQEYEIKLHNEVLKLNLAFRDEEHLRKFGYDKTPDVKLDVPVAVDGFVINWIESKALFGDEDVHKDYTKNQYLSYWNRFGPGLVIYWFSYVKSIVQTDDKRFIIRDHLPTNIVHINYLS
ncbi:CDAN1-interacting nuclease 1 [Tribolium madens]|uniref:CDAN1-interacting nuclease 1 n=1 Tax=Tribolium madens TaxID=41895 RepID=UPI001CF727A8|nr:CDAN1-interacting nuclease 1 [Tribolium madens]